MSDSDYCPFCGANLLLTGMQHNEGCGPPYEFHPPRAPKSSADYEWKLNLWKNTGDTEEEVFEFWEAEFNITRAKMIIQKAPRPIERVSLNPLATLLELMVELDPPKKGRVYDVTFPIIMATLKRSGHVPIDGWHRIDKALKIGLQTIPAVILTAEETRIVRRK